ncbi:carnitine acetyl transferase [Purpureocillium lavendulum]|uniref:Carnitine acetyl transferase n=1 Tax=Purpureocillium lavendulum TaxID=1247861 RepID=A0AB34FK04_9HYPO|nr:carnitine acetyl transferase [Purpureocillium lavendulum]
MAAAASEGRKAVEALPSRRVSSSMPGSGSSAPIDPVLRNTLRYTVSAREYATLHKYIISRSRLLRRSAPSPAAVDKALSVSPSSDSVTGKKKISGGDDYNARAVRHALRVFAATWVGMKGWEAISRRMSDKDGSGKKQPFYKSPALRLSLSLSTILLLYRFLFRFLSRLRAHLMDPQAEPFRRRNPRTTASLTSPYAPAVGASLAGLALGVYPSQQLRVSITIYMMFRALEFGWNMCEGEGLVWGTKNGKKRDRPWWFGSWLLQPLAFGQLLHSCVFDRDCFPEAYGNFIFKHSTAYLHGRPQDWPINLGWPKARDIVDNLAQMARLNWPAYVSPTLFPKKEVLPPSLKGVAPLSSQAHPLITSLSCATLHPSDPSCLRTYLTFWLNSFPPLARFFLVIYSALTIVPRFKSLYHFPASTIQRILSRALRMSTFVTGSISTAWASICFFQAYLPRHVLATQRFFLGGFFAGLWAWVERRHGRGVFLYSARASVDSLWKVGVKRRWWKAMKGGDVWVFVLALMVTGVVYERDAQAIREREWRKGMSWVRGEGWKDWAAADESDVDDDSGDKRKDE